MWKAIFRKTARLPKTLCSCIVALASSQRAGLAGCGQLLARVELTRARSPSPEWILHFVGIRLLPWASSLFFSISLETSLNAEAEN